jgi:hypothetical protein
MYIERGRSHFEEFFANSASSEDIFNVYSYFIIHFTNQLTDCRPLCIFHFRYLENGVMIFQWQGHSIFYIVMSCTVLHWIEMGVLRRLMLCLWVIL